MTFSEALEQLKKGAKVSRSTWNGKGQFVFHSDGLVVPTDILSNPTLKEWAMSNGKEFIRFYPRLDFKAADDVVQVGRLATQRDMPANDWEVV